MKKIFNLKYFAGLSIFIAVLYLFSAFTPIIAESSNRELVGYAWSDNIGYIWFNCKTDPKTSDNCQNYQNYKVSLLTDNSLSGYAWSDNIGWVKFDPSTSGVHTGSGTDNQAAYLDTSTNTFKGWARACSVFESGCDGPLRPDAETGDWEGWISMSGNVLGGSTNNNVTNSGGSPLTGDTTTNDLIVSKGSGSGDNLIVSCPSNHVVTSMSVINFKDGDEIQDMRIICSEIGNGASLNNSNKFTHTVPDGSNLCPANYAVTKLEATNQLNGDTLQGLAITCTQISGATLNSSNKNSGNIGWVQSSQRPTYSCGSGSVMTGISESNMKDGGAIQALKLECTNISLNNSGSNPPDNRTSNPTGSYAVKLTSEISGGRNTEKLSGYAWGSEVLGWISFDNVEVKDSDSVVTVCSANPSGDSVKFTINASGGNGQYKYEWYKGESVGVSANLLSGQNSNTYTHSLTPNESAGTSPVTYVVKVSEVKEEEGGETNSDNVSCGYKAGDLIVNPDGPAAKINDFELRPDIYIDNNSPCRAEISAKMVKSCSIERDNGAIIGTPFVPDPISGPFIIDETTDLTPGLYRLKCTGIDGAIVYSNGFEQCSVSGVFREE